MELNNLQATETLRKRRHDIMNSIGVIKLTSNKIGRASDDAEQQRQLAAMIVEEANLVQQQIEELFRELGFENE